MHCRRWVRVRNSQKCTTRNARHFFILFGSFHSLPPHSAMVLCGIATKGLLWWKFDILKIKNLILPLPALKIATPQKFLESTLTHFRVCWGISSSRFNLLVSSVPLLTIMLVFTLCWQYCNQCKVASASCMNASRELVLLPCYLFIHCWLAGCYSWCCVLTVGMGLVL